MSPLQIEIVLHYYYSPEDWRDGEWNDELREMIRDLAETMALIEIDPRSHPIGLGYRPGTYRITERGRVYVEALKAMPIPIQTWHVPSFSVPPHDQTGTEQ
jgi:hypothetical protein